jgi:hypothetical protein
MNLNRILGFAVGAIVAGYIGYQIYFNDILLMNGKTLGIADEVKGQFGPDDIIKGGAVLGAAALAIRLAHQMGLPAATSPL